MGLECGGAGAQSVTGHTCHGTKEDDDRSPSHLKRNKLKVLVCRLVQQWMRTSCGDHSEPPRRLIFMSVIKKAPWLLSAAFGRLGGCLLNACFDCRDFWIPSAASPKFGGKRLRDRKHFRSNQSEGFSRRSFAGFDNEADCVFKK